MNRKLLFIIILSAILSLILLTCVQCAWSIKMYYDQKEQFIKRVESITYKSMYEAFKMDIVPNIYDDVQSMDINVDLAIFNIYFESNLSEIDIDEPYIADIIELGPDRYIIMQYKSPTALGKHTHSVEIPIDDNAILALRLTINLPFEKFLGKISGILICSIAIVLLLSALMLYMVRTILRQNTLEEMRRNFTHNITHELKTPISVASAATEALRNFSADSDPARRGRYLEIIQLQLSQLAGMVEKILNASKSEKGYNICRARIMVKEMVEEVAAQARMGCSSALETVMMISDDFDVFADRFHLKNVLATIFDNAIKYSSKEDSEDIILIETVAYKENGLAVISISDNGPGIAKEHLPHIFEKFYRVPQGDIQQARGYGLGLFYAKNIIEQHGGEISAISSIGKGTTFTITLPDNNS